MKMINITFLSAVFMLVPVCLSATDWNTPDHGWFHTQKNIDTMDPNYNESAMATICFDTMVFYFSNYRFGTAFGQISIRKLVNTAAPGSGNVNWNLPHAAKTGIPNLVTLGQFNWQPAPVVFNNVLYLFVGNEYNGISYSAYNASTDTWGPLVNVPGDFYNNGSDMLGYGMAAVVVGDRLCLVIQNYWSFIEIFTTTDLVNWTFFRDNWHSGIVTSSGAANTAYAGLSAISQVYKDNGTNKFKLRYAYIDGNKYPHTVECTFDTNGNYQQVSDAVISTERTYQSVSLIEGTVTGDVSSTGHCVQAFLKLDAKDNGYCRYRIQRYQLKENSSWTKQENNLVPQNYNWARQYSTLSAVNYPVADSSNQIVRQFMCLFYCAYNDWDWPIDCAWVETDRLTADDAGAKSIILQSPENTLYIGYIEGPPPYHLNDSTLANPYVYQSAAPISELECIASASSTSNQEIAFDVGGNVSLAFRGFNAGLNAAFGQCLGNEYQKTNTSGLSVIPVKQMIKKGRYITLWPVINRAQFDVNDVNGNRIDTTYYFYMDDPVVSTDTVGLREGLDPGDPATYLGQDSILKTYESKEFGHNSLVWTPGGPGNTSISMQESKLQLNSISGTLKLSDSLKIFNIGFEGSLKYTMTSTTSFGNEITAIANLNPPVNPLDVYQLNYTLWWINPIVDQKHSNWWLHEGATGQNTWCITYDVTYLEYYNGDSYGDPYQTGEPDTASTVIANLSGGKTEAGIAITWKTLKEVNNKGFEVQRCAIDAASLNHDYETLGFIGGRGNCSSTQEYTFFDYNPIPGKSSYRLKLLTADGTFKYSESVEFKPADVISPAKSLLSQNYPNPFKSTTIIKYQVGMDDPQAVSGSRGRQTILVVYDLNGQEVATLTDEWKQTGNYQIVLNASQLSPGVYFYSMTSGSFSDVKKLILLK